MHQWANSDSENELGEEDDSGSEYSLDEAQGDEDEEPESGEEND